MAEFGRELPSLAYGYFTSPVLDETGLAGRYDLAVRFSSAERMESGASRSESGMPGDPEGAVSLFDAVRRQLGVRLREVRRPVPVLVIDHIHREPAAN